MSSREIVMICKKTAGLGLGLSVVLTLSGGVSASDQTELAQRSGCLACHQGYETKIGPAFKEIAGKYGEQKNAAETLANHILVGTGSAGVGWMKAGKATLPAMPPNGNVTPENARKLAKWILEAKGEMSSPGQFATERIEISGAVEKPMVLNVADLRQFPPQ